ncbi:MAG: hypothetical protein AAF432_06105 [Planctomycetota bacterium]
MQLTRQRIQLAVCAALLASATTLVVLARPATVISADFNNDGAFDCLDINALTNEIAAGTNDAAFDLNGDNVVNLDDRDAWLAEAGAANLASGNPFLIGDANLDGLVDGQDFIIWNATKFTNDADYCSGDFNADGVVDGSDFNLWNERKFTSS